MAPSASVFYPSLARALIARDPAQVVSGTPNLDWRLWVRYPDDNAQR